MAKLSLPSLMDPLFQLTQSQDSLMRIELTNLNLKVLFQQAELRHIDL